MGIVTQVQTKTAITNRVEGSTVPAQITVDDITVEIQWTWRRIRPGVPWGDTEERTEYAGATVALPEYDPRGVEIDGSTRPTVRHQVSDDRLADTVDLLIDTARAAASWQRLVRQQCEHETRLLTDAADRIDRILDEVSLRDGRASLQLAATQDRDVLAERIMRHGQLDWDEVADASRMPDERFADLRRQLGGEPGTPKGTAWSPRPLLLSTEGVARRAGVSAATIRSYRSRTDSSFPPADVMLGDTPGWEFSTIDRWTRNRRGRGWRGQGHREEAPQT